jgi:hypothetical protein
MMRYDESSMYREIESVARVHRLPGTMSRVDMFLLNRSGEIAAVAEMKARSGNGSQYPHHWVAVTKRQCLSYVAAGLSQRSLMNVRPLFLWGYDDGIYWVDTSTTYVDPEATTGRKDWDTHHATERIVLVPRARIRPLHHLTAWLDTE